MADSSPSDSSTSDPDSPEEKPLEATAMVVRKRGKLVGHTGYVTAVAFSPDGSTIASGSKDKTIILWDAATRQKKQTLETFCFGETASSVAFSPDGATIVSGNSDGSVRLWDSASGDSKKNLADLGQCVLSVAFSPDGTTIAAGGYSNKVVLWDVASKLMKRTLVGSDWYVSSIAFSPDGATLVSGYGNKCVNVILWNTASGEKMWTQQGHTLFVRSVAFSPDGATVASAGGDGKVILWDTASGNRKATLDHKSDLNCVAFSPDGTTIASGGEDRKIKLWNAITGQKKKVLMGHDSEVLCVAFSPDGAILASTGEDETTIRLWGVATVEVFDPIQHRADRLRLQTLEEELSSQSKALSASNRELADVRQKLADQDHEVATLKVMLRSLEHRLGTSLGNEPLREPFAFVGNAEALCPAKVIPLTHGAGCIAVNVPLHLVPFLKGLWDRGGQKGDRPPRGVKLVRFDALCYQPDHPIVGCVRGTGLQMTNSRKVGIHNKLPEFQDDFSALTISQQHSKKDVVRYLKARMVQPYAHGNANCVYTFHGCSPQVLSGIIEGGFVPLHRNDGGFFGAGVYVTTSVEYASMYAFGDPALNLSPTPPVAPGDSWMPAGCVPVVLCASMLVHAYPLTRDVDYPPGSKVSNFYSFQGSPSKTLKPGCDAHIIPVSNPDFQACAAPTADYWEIVHSKESMVVPMGILWVAK